MTTANADFEDLKFNCPHCDQHMSAPSELWGQSVNCPSCSTPISVPNPKVQVAPYQATREKSAAPTLHVLHYQGHGDVQTNVKQGAIIGGWACFALGLVCMVLSLFTFFLYGPIFFVAFILSIVAMSQRRVLGGISLLLATLIVPTVLGLILFATRSTKFLDEATKTAANSPASTVPSVSEALTKSFADAQRKADLQTLERLKKAKIEFEQKQLSLQSFKVLSAKFHKAEDAIGMKKPVIDLSIENGTSYPIKRASFRGIINSPGRSVPWIDETFSYEISGGVEPGESADWSLAPNMFSEWGKVDPPADSIFTVTVTSLEGADGKSLYSGASFDKADAAKLEALESKLSLEAPGPITPPHS